jgi:uncharacterized small protein (DUF1192 family)
MTLRIVGGLSTRASLKLPSVCGYTPSEGVSPMIDDDPFAPPVKKAVPLEQQLENASIDELEHRIEKLKAEIQLCEKAIGAKRAQREAADSVFGSRPS